MTAKLDAAKKKLASYIKSQSTEMLCQTFALTGPMLKKDFASASTVRAFIMDELETRDQEAFDAWIECSHNEIAETPSVFFLAQAV